MDLYSEIGKKEEVTPGNKFSSEWGMAPPSLRCDSPVLFRPVFPERPKEER